MTSNNDRTYNTVEDLKAACVNTANLLFPDMHVQGIGRQNWEVDGTQFAQPLLLLPGGLMHKLNISVKTNGPEMPDWNFYSHVLHLLSEELKGSALPKQDLNSESIEAARQLLEHGAEMAEAKRILNSHLHRVRAVLLQGAGQWWLGTNLPQTERTGFPSFAQAFDAALTLLENRAGHGAVVVTSADDVAKSMGSRTE